MYCVKTILQIIVYNKLIAISKKGNHFDWPYNLRNESRKNFRILFGFIAVDFKISFSSLSNQRSPH